MSYFKWLRYRTAEFVRDIVWEAQWRWEYRHAKPGLPPGKPLHELMRDALADPERQERIKASITTSNALYRKLQEQELTEKQ